MSDLCKKCGKPPVASRAGSVTSYFFQHNYCQCREERPTISKPAPRPKEEIASKVCKHCGKALPLDSRDGSFTAFLFKELRCQCSSPASDRAASRHTHTSSRVAQRKQFTESRINRSVDIGQTIYAADTIIGGSFRVINLIGTGGMGVVYQVEQIALHRFFALKVLSPELVNEHNWMRFQTEAKTLAGLNHNTFVRVYDLGIHDRSVPFYSMDYLSGRTLEEILVEDGPLSLVDAIHVFLEVLDGLAYAHRNGIIHRDIKPGNIMLCTVDGVDAVKVLDFGISKLVGASSLSVQSLTSTGEIFGSPYYMSPEQCVGSAVDGRSDIYSIGATLFEVLTGYVPFEGRNSLETVMMHQEEDPPSLRDVLPDHDFPDSIDIVLARCMAKLPQQRYQSANDLAGDLKRVLQGREIQPLALKAEGQRGGGRSGIDFKRTERSSEGTYEPEERPSDISRVGLILLLTIVAFSVGGTLWYFLQPQGRDLYGGPHVSPYLSSLTTIKDPKTPENSLKRVMPTSLASEMSDTIKSDVQEIASRESGANQAVVNNIANAGLSSLVTIDRVQYRRFKFPSGLDLGVFSCPTLGVKSKAEGIVELPAGSSLTYIPSPLIAQYPELMARFAPRDIKCVSIESHSDSDAILSAAANIPGVLELNLRDCRHLTPAAMNSINRFQSLITFIGENCSLSAEDLARYNRLHYIENLNCDGISHLTPLLKKLANSNLQELHVRRSMLSKEDIALISNLRGLLVLDIGDNRLDADDIKVLSALPLVDSLDITGAGLGTEIIDGLRAFKALEDVAMFNQGPADLRIAMRKALPKLHFRKPRT